MPWLNFPKQRYMVEFKDFVREWERTLLAKGKKLHLFHLILFSVQIKMRKRQYKEKNVLFQVQEKNHYITSLHNHFLLKLIITRGKTKKIIQ